MIRGQVCQTCRKCGRKIMVITWGFYRKILVDAEVLEVIADPDGEELVRIDGTKVLAREAEPGEIGFEYAYRQHRKTCGVER